MYTANLNFVYSLQASGVQVADACTQAFLDIKKNKKYRYIIFHIKDEKVIDIEKVRNAENFYQNVKMKQIIFLNN